MLNNLHLQHDPDALSYSRPFPQEEEVQPHRLKYKTNCSSLLPITVIFPFYSQQSCQCTYCTATNLHLTRHLTHGVPRTSNILQCKASISCWWQASPDSEAYLLLKKSLFCTDWNQEFSRTFNASQLVSMGAYIHSPTTRENLL